MDVLCYPSFVLALDCKTVVFGHFRKAGSAVSVILECEAREPHILPRRFCNRSRPFVRIWSVARVRKKYGCFVVYTSS